MTAARALGRWLYDHAAPGEPGVPWERAPEHIRDSYERRAYDSIWGLVELAAHRPPGEGFLDALRAEVHES